MIETDIKDIYLGATSKDHDNDIKVYIINTSSEAKTLNLLQGSFQGDEDGLLDLGHSKYKEIIVPANGFIQIDSMDDAGQLDFTTYYNIRVDGCEYLEQINAWSFSAERVVDIPVLNEKGYFSGFSKVGKNNMNTESTKKILYIDMDNVLVDFPSAFSKVNKEVFEQYKDKDDIPDIFSLMEPMKGAIEAFKILSEKYDVYILSTAPWNNPSAWRDKLVWVQRYLGDHALRKLILTHHKNLNRGDYLIDDRVNNGASEFEGEFIQFGSDKFPDWDSILKYLYFTTL